MCECCVGLNVGDESASLIVFSVCADGRVVWYFGCPGCWVELRFLHCDYVRLCSVEEFLSLCVLFWRSFVCCVCGSVQVWGRMEVCVVGKCGESQDGQVVFGLGCGWSLGGGWRDKRPECYNSQCICSNNDEPRGEQGDILQPAKGYTQKHPQLPTSSC